MYLPAERNNIGLRHGISLLTSGFAATAVRLFTTAIPTAANLAQVVMPETDAVRADAIGNYAELVMTVWNVSCRETH
jgi:hypothetical protein